MNGRLATELIEISHDPADLSDGSFWAVSTTFEGGFTAARFATVIDADFPHHAWEKLEGVWRSSRSESEYMDYVKSIQRSIAEGWVYQVNACRELSTPIAQERNLRGLFSQILINNPAPWASYLELPGINIASASPELFLKRTGNRVRTSPIKGTQLPGQRHFGAKDVAENVMIVDLMRNDFGAICTNGTVSVPRLLASEPHPGLVHLVSDVEGELRDGISWSEIISSLQPPGSISGAPKSSAISVITSHESTRGPYCGALGWVEADQCQLSVAIRIFFKDSALRFGTGAGITWGSDPEGEWEETQLKARRLISIAGGSLS
ncbi:MAG: anthranilate synthase component I family protein [Candidatus Planktophila sp.]|nr:anthranilate synthase component I family protein [Candidatus Planktophila sp.]